MVERYWLGSIYGVRRRDGDIGLRVVEGFSDEMVTLTYFSRQFSKGIWAWNRSFGSRC